MTRTGNPAQGQLWNVPTPSNVAAPMDVVDLSRAHDDSLPWTRGDDGVLHASGFNRVDGNRRINHACMDVTYKLDGEGAIAYSWKVWGRDAAGQEIFDSYWFLKGDDGTLLSGTDFLEEREQYSTNVIDGLNPGTYKLTLGVFCLGSDGGVSIDLSPCA
ncbi:MAG: hypothetical protein Q4A07_01015 [Coriobacteriales bacterium]|nr:hypothetical protein [Coriobacteriales bacterium]